MHLKITCPFTLPNSHEIHEVGFRGDNKLKLKLPFKQENFLGLAGTSLEIKPNEECGYYFAVLSDNLNKKEEQVGYLEKAAEFISFLINRNEHNPSYGTTFVQVEWFELKAAQVDESGQPFCSDINISDSTAISLTRTVTFECEPVLLGNYHDLLRFYFDGLKAEHRKSKYFHWFLVLEFLENTEKYKIMFSSNKLFDENEAQKLRDVANNMNDQIKKSAVLNILSRTKESRNHKLLKLINALGIFKISGFEKVEDISLDTIKRITDGRNALFHSGTDFPESTLWAILFPLVTQLVEHVSCNPGCLDT